MATKITLGNSKGGVGKTVITNLFAYHLAERGNKTLVVDIDPQGNTTSLYEKKYYNGEKQEFVTLYEALKGNDLTLGINRVDENLHFIASSLDTVYIENLLTPKTKVTLLRKYIEKIESNYDFIFFDVPPTTFSIFLNNALGASDYFVVLTETSSHSFDGVPQFYNTAMEVHDKFNPKLDFLGILINRREKDAETYEKLNEEFNFKEDDTFFRNSIPQRTRLTKYSESGIYNYKPKSRKKDSLIEFDKWDVEVKEYIDSVLDELLEKIEEV